MSTKFYVLQWSISGLKLVFRKIALIIFTSRKMFKTSALSKHNTYLNL